MKDLQIDAQDLASNPSTRLPVCLILDTSISMKGPRIEKLNEGVKMFKETVCSDEILKISADVSIITFGCGRFSFPNFLSNPKKEIKEILDFGNIADSTIPALNAGGHTPMGEAVLVAVEKLGLRKQLYKDNGIEYYQPWLVLMTDGQPYDIKRGLHSIDDAANKTSELVRNNKLIVLPIGVGDDEELNMEVLKRFSPKTEPLRLQGLNFKEFFDWLTQSMHIVTKSMPGETVDLPQPTWAQITI